MEIKVCRRRHKNRKGVFMKKRLFSLSVLVSVLALSFAVVSCDNGTTDNGSAITPIPVDKSLSLTGITQSMIDQSNAGVVVGVWKSGTSLDTAAADLEALFKQGEISNAFVAFNMIMDPNEPRPVVGTAYLVPLFDFSGNNKHWAGSGTHMVVIFSLAISIDMTNLTSTYTYTAYQINDVSITNATTSVAVPGTSAKTGTIDIEFPSQ